MDLCNIWFCTRALLYPEICSHLGFHRCNWFRATRRVSTPKRLAQIPDLLVDFTSFHLFLIFKICRLDKMISKVLPEASSSKAVFPTLYIHAFFAPTANTAGNEVASPGWSEDQTPRWWGHIPCWAGAQAVNTHLGVGWAWQQLSFPAFSHAAKVESYLAVVFCTSLLSSFLSTAEPRSMCSLGYFRHWIVQHLRFAL